MDLKGIKLIKIFPYFSMKTGMYILWNGNKLSKFHCHPMELPEWYKAEISDNTARLKCTDKTSSSVSMINLVEAEIQFSQLEQFVYHFSHVKIHNVLYSL